MEQKHSAWKSWPWPWQGSVFCLPSLRLPLPLVWSEPKYSFYFLACFIQNLVYVYLLLLYERDMFYSTLLKTYGKVEFHRSWDPAFSKDSTYPFSMVKEGYSAPPLAPIGIVSHHWDKYDHDFSDSNGHCGHTACPCYLPSLPKAPAWAPYLAKWPLEATYGHFHFSGHRIKAKWWSFHPTPELTCNWSIKWGPRIAMRASRRPSHRH